jgi:hypothetical protein
MSGGIIFEYKCAKGHLTERRYPPGTPYSKHAEIECPNCAEEGKYKDAYIMFARPESKSEKKSV